MIRKKYVCMKCEAKFEKEVFELGEPQKRRVSAYPVRCPNCGSMELMEADRLR